MCAERVSLDANILFYAIDRDAGERHRRAIEVMRRVALDVDCLLTVQALAEFFAATTRKGKMAATEAAAQVEDWLTLFPVAAATPTSLRRALRVMQHHRLDFWDAMLWAAAREAGVTLLLSEDLQDGQVIEGVRFSNPFAKDDPLA
jgi:predicted nucleic acid-binding protein